mgnify:CR=1 FL=1
MEKYYTRACNFYYGNHSKYKLKKKASIPLNGNNLISFDTVEILSRNSKKVVHLNEIKNLPNRIKIKVKKDLKNRNKEKKITKKIIKDNNDFKKKKKVSKKMKFK